MKGHTYLLIVDHYSRYIKVAPLNRTTAEEVILYTKSIFARHGIPEVVISDNGPQYSSEAYANFARKFQFELITSSPHYPQSNGEAEWAVQTVKNLESNKEAWRSIPALLSYRSMPLKCGFSPSELLMPRKLRTNLLTTRDSLRHAVPDLSLVRRREEQMREQAQQNYNRRH
jgi:transposase InsO family protein